MAVDGVASRRQRAAELGAIVADPAEATEYVREIANRTGRGGADTVLEAVGLPAAQQLSFQLVRPGGVISAVGMHTAAHFTFSPEDAYNRNLTYSRRTLSRSLVSKPIGARGRIRGPDAPRFPSHHTCSGAPARRSRRVPSLQSA